MNSKEIIKPDHVLKKLKSPLESVLCVVHESSHFAVIHMSLKGKEIIVYDGLNTGINWRRHSRKLLQRLGEIPVTASTTNIVNVDLPPVQQTWMTLILKIPFVIIHMLPTTEFFNKQIQAVVVQLPVVYYGIFYPMACLNLAIIIQLLVYGGLLLTSIESGLTCTSMKFIWFVR